MCMHAFGPFWGDRVSIYRRRLQLSRGAILFKAAMESDEEELVRSGTIVWRNTPKCCAGGGKERVGQLRSGSISEVKMRSEICIVANHQQVFFRSVLQLD